MNSLHRPVVPFDHNHAERDLHRLKVPQKISGVFRDPTRADAFCRLWDYVATSDKQARRCTVYRERGKSDRAVEQRYNDAR